MGAVLQIDHKSDIANAYCQAFREKLVFRNFTFPHALIKATDHAAERQNVEAILKGATVDYISASGHGEFGQLFGEDGVPIWEADPIAQPALQPLAGKIVHLLSCGTGSYLGPTMIDFGAACFWGYAAEFSFSREEFGPPENDAIAELFFEMDAIIDRGILNGNPAQVIYNDVSIYMINTAAKLVDPIDRSIFLDNYMVIVCPVVSSGDPLRVLS